MTKAEERPVGCWIPSYTYKDLSYDRVKQSVRDFSIRADELGLDLWVIDHLLHAEGLYGVSWLEPMTTLTYAAALVPGTRVGTGILVLPLRHPVMLAKEIATLDYLTSGRFVFGIGPGWFPDEYTAVGNDISERGRRTDEVLSAVLRLLSEDKVSFEGRFFKFDDVTIEPRPPKLPQVWAGGGSRIPDPDYHDVPVMARPVLDRIVRSDGWISRCAGNQDFVKNDWQQVQKGLQKAGKDRSEFTFSHCQFTYLVDTSNREKALEVQRPFFEEIMGTHRTFEHLQESYLLGSMDDILARIQDLIDVGLDHLMLGPTSDDPKQLDLIAREIVPLFSP
jgi:alkanesulfonate monooxygenase